MKPKQLLLISKRPEDVIFARELAAFLKMPLIMAETSQEAVKIVTDLESTPLVVADISDQADLEDYEKFQKVPAKNVHFITEPDLVNTIFLRKSHLFSHFVVRAFADIKESATHFGRIVNSICLKQEEPTTVEWLNPPPTPKKITCTSSEEKEQILLRVEEFLHQETAFSERAIPVIVTALDEIIMNAIYDAPVDENGEQKYKKISRTTPIKLDEKDHVEIHVSYNGNYGMFTVIDSCGSLKKERLFAQFTKSQIGYDFQVNPEAAGAGIGLAGTLRSGGSLVFVGTSGVRTCVTVIFKPIRKFAEFRNQFRFVATQLTSKAS